MYPFQSSDKLGVERKEAERTRRPLKENKVQTPTKVVVFTQVRIVLSGSVRLALAFIEQDE